MGKTKKRLNFLETFFLFGLKFPLVFRQNGIGWTVVT